MHTVPNRMKERIFQLTPPFDGEEEEALLEALGARTDPPSGGSRKRSTAATALHPVAAERTPLDLILLDSFDWRLHKRGAVVEFDRPARLVGWRALKGVGGLTLQYPLATPPRWPSDLPPGRLRARLEALLEMRALLPLARLRGSRRTLRLEDGNGKMRVRLEVEHARLSRPHGGGGRRSIALPPLLRVIPLRGYAAEAKRTVAALRALGLHERPPVYPDELPRLALHPGVYQTKPLLREPPEQRADVAVKALLHQLLDVMMLNESGMLEDIDSEFLHDYRVALRRSRSALGQMKGLFPRRDFERFKRGLYWLGGVTSPLRDLDVQLLKLPHFRAELPEPLHHALDPLERLLLERRAEERKRLLRSFASKRYRQLIEQWRAFLEAPPREPARLAATLPGALEPIVESAARRVRKMYRRVVDEGNAIDESSPDEAYHDLRKSCKKLRYLMEFFTPLFDAPRVAALIATVKGLHNILGDLQDIHVQLADFDGYRDDLLRRGELEEETATALSALGERLEQRRGGEIAAYRDAFAALTRRDTAHEFKQLFGKRAAAAAADGAGGERA